MPYIGKQLSNGNYLKLDDISSSFNSSTTTFSLTNGGSAYYPGSEFSILVSVGGVIQEPESAYQINNDEITFANAPTAQDSFFCVVLGDAIGINVPGNNTVNGAQMAKPFNYDGGLLYLNDTDNRVGINSTSPQAALDVVGDLNVSGNISGIGGTLGGTLVGNVYASSGISTFNDLLVNGDLTVQGDTTTLNTTLRNVELLRVSTASTLPAGIVTQTGTGDILQLYDNTTQAVTVQDGGRVLIGTTDEGHGNADDLTIATAAGSLGNTGITIRSSTTGDGNIFFSDATSGDGETKGVVKYAHDGDSLLFNTAGDERLRIDSSGRVLVGTANTGTAAQMLTLYRASTSALELRTNTTGKSTIHFTDADGGATPSGNASYRGFIEYKHDDDYMRFATSASEKLRITSAGKVGINTTTASSTLQIYGANDGEGTATGQITLKDTANYNQTPTGG